MLGERSEREREEKRKRKKRGDSAGHGYPSCTHIGRVQLSSHAGTLVYEGSAFGIGNRAEWKQAQSMEAHCNAIESLKPRSDVAQFVFAKSEVVSDFVNDGKTNLLLNLLFGAADRLDVPLI